MGTGGTIARYSAEGARVCLITCTNGEVGEIAEHPELGDIEQGRSLARVRQEELREACRLLGDVDLRLLGYHDSGMDGTPQNDRPESFVNQDLDEVVRKIVAILREVRPQVLVTYNEIGFYGHPDHVRAHQAALAAVDAASDPTYEPDVGPAHAVSKIYYTAMPRSFLEAARTMSKEFGFDEDDFISEEELMNIATDDANITTSIDVTAFVDRKFQALAAHLSQLGTTKQLLGIPEDLRPFAMGTEHYVLARSEVPAPEGKEQDLFEGTGA
jgi:N-acetyl-1-D-myo-inositol-2-amino-2-deoxy-alpha-D-glucopyranoside deacetylase